MSWYYVSSLSEAEKAELVQEAIEYLDRSRLVPGDWRDMICWARIDINNVYDCILGQIFGSFNDDKAMRVYDASVQMWPFYYPEFNQAWKDALSEDSREELQACGE